MQETLTSEGNNSPQRDATLIRLCSLNTVDNRSPFVDLFPDAPWCRGCCCTAACSDVTAAAAGAAARVGRPRPTRDAAAGPRAAARARRRARERATRVAPPRRADRVGPTAQRDQFPGL